MALLRKKNQNGQTPAKRQQVIKVNPYENPENVLELMAKICSATQSADTELFWEVVRDAYNKEINGVSLSQYISDNRSKLWNPDFYYDLIDFCRDLSWALTEHQNSKDTQIVVAGGFSSGKSSFLNKLTGCNNLLPTGVEPVSVVKTYLYCSKQEKSVSVRGVNQKNVLVDLNVGVLQAIQHANKSNIYLASVLDKLFVRIPSTKLDGLVFIDTPGYNNSDKANASNGKTDKETALEAMGEGNVLFWLVDCERGTTVTDDIQIIKQFEGKKVIIFNKADKKGKEQSKKIVEEAARVIYKEFEAEDIIDILAYSVLDDMIYYSKKNLSLEDIIKVAKLSGNGLSEIANIKSDMEDLFDTEINASRNTVEGTKSADGYKKDLKDAIEDKDKRYNLWQKDKDKNEGFLESIKDIMLTNYSELYDGACQLQEFAHYAWSSWEEFHKSVLDAENSRLFSSSDLNSAISDSADAYNAKCKQFYNFELVSAYKKRYREGQYKIVEVELENLNDFYKDWYEDSCEKCDLIRANIKVEEELQHKMGLYKDLFMSAIEMGIRNYNQHHKATDVSEESKVLNIFDCIKRDDYKEFLHCFENGIDLSICDADGYNPMTLAVEVGNNMMVQFLLDHDADPSIKDKRGYNAIHTAVENQYRDMCTLLLDVDPDLINSKTASGESVEDLAKKQSFNKWLELEIKNAL